MYQMPTSVLSRISVLYDECVLEKLGHDMYLAGENSAQQIAPGTSEISCAQNVQWM